MKIVIAAVAAIALAGPLAAGTQPAMSSSAARASDAESVEVLSTTTNEKVVCRRDKTTGSRLRAERICLTPAQWAVRLREARVKLEQGQAQRTWQDNSGL